MFVTALLLGLVGVFCILDSRILGRMNFERPLITCTIVGALLGDLQTGLTLGASIELMSLGIVMLMFTLIRKKVKTGWLLGICIVGGVAINALGLLV